MCGGRPKVTPGFCFHHHTHDLTVEAHFCQQNVKIILIEIKMPSQNYNSL